MLAQTGSDWGIYQMPVTILIGAGVAVLAILRWREADIKKLRKEIEGDFRSQMDAMSTRITGLENKVAHLENGSIAATMKLVEIKSTSQEPRTQELAQAGIEALSLQLVSKVEVTVAAVQKP